MNSMRCDFLPLLNAAWAWRGSVSQVMTASCKYYWYQTVLRQIQRANCRTCSVFAVLPKLNWSRLIWSEPWRIFFFFNESNSQRCFCRSAAGLSWLQQLCSPTRPAGNEWSGQEKPPTGLWWKTLVSQDERMRGRCLFAHSSLCACMCV